MEREFTVIIEQDEERYFVATVRELYGCHTQARSLDELMERVVVSAMAGGASLEEVTEAYALTIEQVQACLAFAAEILREEQFLAIPA